MVLNAQRTIFGISLQLYSMLGLPYKAVPNSTLNEKFNLNANLTNEDKLPTLKYYTVGVGGQDIIAGNNGYSYSTHTPFDAALFTHVPFVIKPVSEDLLPSEQSVYRFKIKETINGVEYYCYYLKLIPSVDIRDGFYKVTTSGDITKLSMFNTDTDHMLNPVAKNRSINKDNFDTSEYIAKTAKLEFTLFNAELANLREAMMIKFGNELHLTEIGVCCGNETTVNGRNEAIDVQIMYHVALDLETSIYANLTEDFVRTIEIGGMESIRN